MVVPRKQVDAPDYQGPDRRELNGNGGWTSLKAWANAIGVVGIPGAIAIYGVYIAATYVPSIVRNGELAIIEIRQNRDVLREHIVQTDKLIRVVRQTCYNAAKDANAQRACYDD